MRLNGFVVSAALMVAIIAPSVIAENQSESGKSTAQEKSSDKQNAASSSGKSTQSPGSGKCMKSMMRCCADRAKNSVSTIDGVMTSLDKAGSSNDPEQMKAAIESARKALSGLKEEHNKSYHLLEAATKHLEKIRKQANSKTKKMIDESDASWDDVIWAF